MRYLLAIIAFAFTVNVHAATSPLGVSIVNPVQFPPKNWTVTGVRLNTLWGYHQNVYGIDVGLVNSSERFRGLSLAGLMNYTGSENYVGLAQVAGLMNFNKGKTKLLGVQFAALSNYNKGESTVNGVQFSLANVAGHTTVNGVQLGVYNEARTVRGFQIGLVNRTQNLTGIQIGLINYYHKGLFKIAPFLNAGF